MKKNKIVKNFKRRSFNKFMLLNLFLFNFFTSVPANSKVGNLKKIKINNYVWFLNKNDQ